MPQTFPRNFLKEVLIRVDFQPELQGLGDKEIQSLRDDLAECFPIYQPPVSPNIVLQISKAPPSQAPSAPPLEHEFYSESRDKKVTLSYMFLSIVYYKFEDFDSLKSDFLTVMNILDNMFADLEVRRIGLRYVNVIDLKEARPLDWNGYIVPELLGGLDFAAGEKHASRVFNMLHLRYGDMNLKFQYGIHNPDFPQPIRTKQFILDYDAYEELVTPAHDVTERLDEYRLKIWGLFSKSIGPKLRRMLERE